MRKLITALAVAVAACLIAAATAVADPGPIQVSGQSADTQQQAAAASGATQVNPSNTNISIRVLSPGSDGPVTQSNTADSSAAAGNAASTTQNADQSAGTSGIQTSQQSAGTDQLAIALSAAKQENASNTNVPIRVQSPGSDGAVTQSNNAKSSAAAGNQADTTQDSSQAQAGSSCGCAVASPAPAADPSPSSSSSPAPSAIQSSDQQAQTDQASLAGSEAKQIDPSNTAVSIRVLSPGDNGSVSQSNDASSSARSGNKADTTQKSDQTQGGGSTPVWSSRDCGCTSSSPIQVAKQDASTKQDSAALSAAVQKDPSNTASPVRVSSPGSDGSVTQSNDAMSSATSGNAASTTQTATQDPSGSDCGCGGTPIQVADQKAETDQSSAALSAALQSFGSKHDECGCDSSSSGNTASPVRVYSPGSGGDVSQSNDASSSAKSGNLASTTQDGTQSADSGSPIQVLGQQADTQQESLAASLAAQDGASNDASPVRVWSPGSDGSVTQSNDAMSSATSGNAASTTQTATQDPSGSDCGCGGTPIQVLGQQAETEQSSAALSAALQLFGKRHDECGCSGSSSGNTASPVRVYSPGSGGDVTQSNDASSSALSGNLASTTQDGTQTANGGGLTIQALGQKAETDQGSLSASLAAQFGPSNNASPVRVWSPGGGGSVTQTNGAASSAAAGNASRTDQTGRQDISGGRCGCEKLPIQVAGQWAGTAQLAPAFSAALQLDANNDSSPAFVKSPGDVGALEQTNKGASNGDAGNLASSGQEVDQTS
jgi:hypothetical protein